MSTALLALFVIAFTAVAAFIDCALGKVPNWLTVPCFVAALIFHFVMGFVGWSGDTGGWSGAWRELGWAVLGFATGFGILWVLWMIGGGKAGDVKLMGALCAWLLPQTTLYVFIITCIFVVALVLSLIGWNLVTGRWSQMQKDLGKADKGRECSEKMRGQRSLAAACSLWSSGCIGDVGGTRGSALHQIGPAFRRMANDSNNAIWQRYRCRRRKGAILSIEWLFALPVLIAVMFAVTEFSLLWSAKHLLEAATYAAAREASLPAMDEPTRRAAAVAAAERILGDPDYVVGDPFGPNGTTTAPLTQKGYRFDEYSVGLQTGDPITITLSMPMDTAAPDLLKVIGISIADRATKRLKATTVIRRE